MGWAPWFASGKRWCCSTERGFEPRRKLEQIVDQSNAGSLEDRYHGVLVDRHDRPGATDTGEVLDLGGGLT